MDSSQHLQEELAQDLKLLKKLEERRRCEDDPRRRQKLETDIREIKQQISKRKAELPPVPIDPPLVSSPQQDRKLVGWVAIVLVAMGILYTRLRPPQLRPTPEPPDYTQLENYLKSRQWEKADLA
ncbi:MAG: hypothetical protein J7641_21330 [Cyanobacteria bacterium SID2]|nr:hypothetical protein [Cyanobacteria bacterium SID2]MBP0006347.1 hypothetical protein [Cyanobacteria bacterium SBC]